MPGFLTRLFGSANERTLRRLWPVVEEINGFEESFRALPDEAFPEKTAGFRQRLAEAEDEDVAAALDEILPEAFAAATPTAATSPTAPTTSSASTTCATT